MALVGYSSSEDELEKEDEENEPLPSFTCDFIGDEKRFASESRNAANIENDGRVRSFAHKHGNWATSVFVPGKHITKVPFAI